MTGRGPFLCQHLSLEEKTSVKNGSGKETSPHYLHWEPLPLLFAVVVVVVAVFVVSYPFFQGANANMASNWLSCPFFHHPPRGIN